MIHFSEWPTPLRRQAAALSLIAVLILVSVASAADLDFNVANGNYNVAGNWVDAQTGAPAAAPPAYVDETTFDNAYVRNNGTLVINSDVSNRMLRIGAEKDITPPDYNGNGSVDAGDYVLWRKGGTLQNDPTPGSQPGDYTFWRSRFGDTGPQEIGQPGTLNWTAGRITASSGPIPSTGPDIATINNTYYGPEIRVGQRDGTTNTNFTGIVNQSGGELNLLHNTSRLNIGDQSTTPNPVSTYNFSNGTIGLIIGYVIPFIGEANGSNGNNGINVRNGIFNMTGGQIIDKTADVVNQVAPGTSTVDQRFMTISSASGTMGSENSATANFSGGTVNVLGGLRAAINSHSRGYVNFTGPVVMQVGADFSVGYNATNGVGEMNMSDGQLTVGKRLQIGHRGVGTLNLSGGSITTNSDLRVGAEVASSNSLINMTGGSLTAKQLQMQLQVGAGTPTIRVNGPNAVFTQGPLGGVDTATIGEDGASLFEVQQGQATLHRVELGATFLSTGTVSVTGGNLKIRGPVVKTDPAATPTVNLTGGTLEITPAVAGTATWQTSFTNAGSNIVLNPNALQQVTISTTAGSASTSNFAMSSGSWDLQIGSNVTASGADRFIVNGSGTAALAGGVLNISHINAYTPAINDTLTILQGPGGATLNAGAVTLAGNPGWSLISNATQIQLKYVGPGAGSGAGLATSVVPEPTSSALIAFAFIGLLSAKGGDIGRGRTNESRSADCDE